MIGQIGTPNLLWYNFSTRQAVSSLAATSSYEDLAHRVIPQAPHPQTESKCLARVNCHNSNRTHTLGSNSGSDGHMTVVTNEIPYVMFKMH